MTPNRIVAGAVALLGLVVLAAGLLADLGTAPKVAALAAGAVTLLTPAVVWLRGWQAYEARQGEADQPVGWEDLREQLARVTTALGRIGAGGPDVASAAVSEIGFVATRLTEALAASRPERPPVVDPMTAVQAAEDASRHLEVRVMGQEDPIRIPLDRDARDAAAPRTEPAEEDAAEMEDALAAVADLPPGPEDLMVESPEALPPEERGAP